MVYYSELAIQDLTNIVTSLATWEKHPLGYEHAESYVDDMADHIDTICKKTHHMNTVYLIHKHLGEKVYTYKRNRHTQWYIIYDWNLVDKVAYVRKILNNYLTY
jgi:hypothetical protein